MLTRQDYINGYCTHDQYYGQFVFAEVEAVVVTVIGEQKILNSSDPINFNDIPLREWDRLHLVINGLVGNSIKQSTNGFRVTLCETVCTAKRAAKMFYDRNVNHTQQLKP